MKHWNAYFKSEAAAMVFILTETDGETRADLLGITKKLYSDPEAAGAWYLGILDKIRGFGGPAEDLAKKKLDRLFTGMIGPDGCKPKPTEKEPVKENAREAAGAAPVDPFKVFREAGEDGLKAALEEMGLEALRELIKNYDLDPTKQCARARKPERLREVAFAVTRQRATKGDGFI